MVTYMIKLGGFDNWQPIEIDSTRGVVKFKGYTIEERSDIVTGWVVQRIERGELYLHDSLTPMKRIPRHDTMSD